MTVQFGKLKTIQNWVQKKHLGLQEFQTDVEED